MKIAISDCEWKRLSKIFGFRNGGELSLLPKSTLHFKLKSQSGLELIGRFGALLFFIFQAVLYDLM